MVGVARAIVYEEIDEYIDGLANRGDAALRAVEKQGLDEGWPIVGAAEGSLLHILARSSRAKRILELGTAIGYSGTWLARALPDDGELVTVEHNPETAEIARKNLEKTGVEKKVRILVGPAQSILADLKGPFDRASTGCARVGFSLPTTCCGGATSRGKIVRRRRRPSGRTTNASRRIRGWSRRSCRSATASRSR